MHEAFPALLNLPRAFAFTSSRKASFPKINPRLPHPGGRRGQKRIRAALVGAESGVGTAAPQAGPVVLHRLSLSLSLSLHRACVQQPTPSSLRNPAALLSILLPYLAPR